VNGKRPGGTRERLYASTTDTFDGDLDFIAIDYALNGEPVRLTTAEKIHAARILDGRGFGVVEIGRRIGTTRDTVSAWKNNDWQAAGSVSKKSQDRMIRRRLSAAAP